MRTALFGTLLATCLAAMPLTSKSANALPSTAPAGMAAAADALSETQKVTYYGYGYGYRPWRPYYGYYRPWRPYYGYYRPWRPYYGYYRPYYRPVYYGYRPWRPYYGGYYRPWIRPAFYGPRFYGGWGYRRYW